MKCAFHPKVDAVGSCVRCRRSVCADCQVIWAQKLYCKGCVDELVGAGVTSSAERALSREERVASAGSTERSSPRSTTHRPTSPPEAGSGTSPTMPERVGWRTRDGIIPLVLSIVGLCVLVVVWPGGSTSSPTSDSPAPSESIPVTQPDDSGPPPVTEPEDSESIPLTAPDDSFVVWDDNSEWSDWTSITISGSVTNTHDKWSIKDAKIEVRKFDENEKLVGTTTVHVVPSTISPGGEGTYYKKLVVPSSCELFDGGLSWHWVAP